MAFDLPGPGRSSRRVVAEINVAPLVDVMLVLLIVFMIAAPMMSQGIDVELPETTASAIEQAEKPLVISVDKEGLIFFDEIEVSRQLLAQQLASLAREVGTDQSVLLRADREVPYGVVAAVMADVKAAGFNQMGMITQPLPTERR